MPQIDPIQRKEYNRLAYAKKKLLKQKEIKMTEKPIIVAAIKIEALVVPVNNYDFIKFYKQIVIVNTQFQSVILKPLYFQVPYPRSILKFQRWDSTTKLVILHKYNGGMYLYTLREFCLQNGMASGTSRKLKYGELAEWVLKVLV